LTQGPSPSRHKYSMNLLNCLNPALNFSPSLFSITLIFPPERIIRPRPHPMHQMRLAVEMRRLNQLIYIIILNICSTFGGRSFVVPLTMLQQ